MNAVSGRPIASWSTTARVAADDAALLQPAHPLVDRGGGQPGGPAQVGVAHPAVGQEQADDACGRGLPRGSGYAHPSGRRAARTGPGGTMTAMTERLMLLDSASLYFRAFYGVPDTRRSPTSRRPTRCAASST